MEFRLRNCANLLAQGLGAVWLHPEHDAATLIRTGTIVFILADNVGYGD